MLTQSLYTVEAMNHSLNNNALHVITIMSPKSKKVMIHCNEGNLYVTKTTSVDSLLENDN